MASNPLPTKLSETSDSNLNRGRVLARIPSLLLPLHSVAPEVVPHSSQNIRVDGPSQLNAPALATRGTAEETIEETDALEIKIDAQLTPAARKRRTPIARRKQKPLKLDTAPPTSWLSRFVLEMQMALRPLAKLVLLVALFASTIFGYLALEGPPQQTTSEPPTQQPETAAQPESQQRAKVTVAAEPTQTPQVPEPQQSVLALRQDRDLVARGPSGGYVPRKNIPETSSIRNESFTESQASASYPNTGYPANRDVLPIGGSRDWPATATSRPPEAHLMGVIEEVTQNR